MAIALQVAGLRKSYADMPVLGPIDVGLAAGSISVVIGRSGCGKTTLLRCLGGLETPDAGSVTAGGAALRRESVGYVFQEPRLMPWLSVARNVGFGLAAWDPERRDRAVAAALDRIGLPDAGQALPKQLSGGMAQRVALARGLAPEPDLLLLDEPFSALDPFTRAQMQEHLLHLHRAYGTTIVLITHDMDEALVLADRILVMRGGHGVPGHIAADLAPALARPRRPADPLLSNWRASLAGLLSES